MHPHVDADRIAGLLKERTAGRVSPEASIPEVDFIGGEMDPLGDTNPEKGYLVVGHRPEFPFPPGHAGEIILWILFNLQATKDLPEVCCMRDARLMHVAREGRLGIGEAFARACVEWAKFFRLLQTTSGPDARHLIEQARARLPALPDEPKP